MKKLIKLLLLPFKWLLELLKRILSLFKREKKVKYTDYDYFLYCCKATRDLNLDFRAEYDTEQIKVIVNPLKPIKTPRKPKKEVKEEIEVKENEENN